MRLKKLELRNWRQHHEEQTIVFQSGITGLFGPNGCGKTNLLDAMKFNLTGEVPGPLPKDKSVCRRIKEGEPSYVTGHWQHDDINFIITRRLRPSTRQSLTIGDGSPITSATEIVESIQELLGMPMKMIEDFLFVAQWRIFDFLTLKTEDRAKALGQMCGTDKLETLWKLLGDQQTTDAHLAGESTIDEDALKNRHAELCKRLLDLKQEIRTARKSVLKKAEGLELKRIVRGHQILVTSRERIADLQGKIAIVEKSIRLLAKREQHWDKLKTVRQKAWDDVSGKRQEYETALKNLATIEEQTEIQEECERILKRKPPAFRHPEVKRVSGDIRNEIADVNKKVEAARKVIDTFKSSGKTKCPTCGTPTSELKSHLIEQQKIANRSDAELNKLRTELAEATAYEGAKHQHQEELGRFELEKMKATERLESSKQILKKLSLPKASKEEIEAELSSIDEVAQRYNRISKKLTDLRTGKLGKLRSRIEILKGELATWQRKQKEAEAAGEVEPDEAVKKLQAHRDALTTCRVLSTQVETTEHDMEAVSKELKTAELAKSRHENGIKWLGDLEDWRDVVHRNNLPRIITSSYLSDLVETINENLESFESPFTVSAADDLSLLVHNEDGTIEPAVQKSGGEKVVLAIAYRMAVNPDEFLVLDEPTSGLDKENLGCLLTVLKNLAKLTRKQGRQIIMVTHDERLEPVFNRTITLNKKDLN